MKLNVELTCHFSPLLESYNTAVLLKDDNDVSNLKHRIQSTLFVIYHADSEISCRGQI